jgi:hypothetical protein
VDFSGIVRGVSRRGRAASGQGSAHLLEVVGPLDGAQVRPRIETGHPPGHQHL